MDEPITFRCPACDQPLKFPAARAGRKAKCTKCGADLTVPDASAPPPAPPPPPPSGEDEEGPKEYGLVVDAGEEKVRKPPEKKKKKEKGQASIKKKKKSLPDAELWAVVRHGLLLMSIGAAIWGIIFSLRTLLILLGTTQGPQYNILRDTVLLNPQDPLPGAGDMGNLDYPRFVVAMLSGEEQLSFSIAMQTVLAFLTFVQIAFFMMGYFTCMVIPARFGSKGQVLTMILLGGFNVIPLIAFRLLPLLGVVSYTLIPYFAPELPMITVNIERNCPLHVFWSQLPFLEFFLTFIFLGAQYLEYNLIAVFLNTIGLSIKDEPTQDSSTGLIQLGFGTLFALLCYYLVSIGGCSDVLVTVLRLIYLLWSSFLLLYIVRLVFLLNSTRATITKLVDMEMSEAAEKEEKERAERKDKKKKRRQEEEDDEQDEGDDDDDEPPRKRKKR